jgi:hypothetical protein
MLAPNNIEIEPNNTNIASCFGEIPAGRALGAGLAEIRDRGGWGSDMGCGHCRKTFPLP